MTLVLERRATVADSFAFAPGARDALPLFQGRCTVVRLASIDNELLGIPHWLTLAEAWTEPGTAGRRRWSDNPVVMAGPDDDPHLVVATLTPVVMVGADNAAHGYARAVIDAVRAACHTVLVADVGHRPTGHAYADVATFGFDPARGSALLELLTA